MVDTHNLESGSGPHARERKRVAQTDVFVAVSRLLTTGTPSAEDELTAVQRRAGVLRHVDTLPEREREVILLSAVNELPNVEIALVLKTTIRPSVPGCTVHVRHFRSSSGRRED